jgi:uncharacterized membrane protein AbrB (regulator of aidB expression)
MEHLVALWLAAVLGGLAARRLGVPGGTLLGALLATALFTLIDTRVALLPGAMTASIQALVGIMLGLSVDRRLFAVLRAHTRLVAATAVLTVLTWAMMALAAAATGLLEPSGAVLGSAPAGPSVSLLVSGHSIALGTVSLLLVLRVAVVGSVLSVFLKLRGHPWAQAKERAWLGS